MPSTLTKTIAGLSVGGALIVGGIILTDKPSLANVTSQQDKNLSEKGEYVHETDGIYTTNTYDGPKGKGYFVTWTDTDGYHSVGYGPQADEFTYLTPVPAPAPYIASTTP